MTVDDIDYVKLAMQLASYYNSELKAFTDPFGDRIWVYVDFKMKNDGTTLTFMSSTDEDGDDQASLDDACKSLIEAYVKGLFEYCVQFIYNEYVKVKVPYLKAGSIPELVIKLDAFCPMNNDVSSMEISTMIVENKHLNNLTSYR